MTNVVLDVAAWRPATRDEFKAMLDKRRGQTSAPRKKRAKPTGSSLAVRTHLTTLDMYSYLKAKFGPPNGLQSMMRSDDSDNIFHWDWNLKAGDTDVYILGMSRETHFQIGAVLTDHDWKSLIIAIKQDFGRIGRDKSEASKSLEKWLVFPNKYVAISNLCEDKHDRITDQMGKFAEFAPASRRAINKKGLKDAQDASKRASSLTGDILELRILTPILVEAFLNMMILILCKPEVRQDKRQYQAFIRSEIDIKVSDLFYKCRAFQVAPNSAHPEFVAFHKVMQKRNYEIHGNIDPDRDTFETVYFDGTIPTYPVPGDHISTFYANLERQYDPISAVADYEAVHLFIAYLIDCLEPQYQEQFRLLVDDPYPGWNEVKQTTGVLFPGRTVSAYFKTRFDDELKVDWS
ncbi:hypothetical protein [Brevundimonas sp. DWR2-3-1b1]|uniref:hypothetical protein n=1 Tax=unclassified Brevundimonas TaxID=2622653 RepID=UPI003CEC372E